LGHCEHICHAAIKHRGGRIGYSDVISEQRSRRFFRKAQTGFRRIFWSLAQTGIPASAKAMLKILGGDRVPAF